MNSMDFDFQELHNRLLKAARQAFQKIQQTHQDEHFYSFALYTSGELIYVIPTASTEEGLTQVAQRYLAQNENSAHALEEQRIILRWSPCDSPLHEEGAEEFVEVDELLDAILEITDSLYDPVLQSWEKVDAFTKQVEDVFFAVLQTLDVEGLFGTQEERLQITLNLLMGDQSDEKRIDNAQRLNPPVVWQRLARELADSNEFYEKSSPDFS